MLTLQQIKENPQEIVKRLAVKGFDGTEPIREVIENDDRRRALQLENDNLASVLKKHAAEIGKLMKTGAKEEAEKLKATVSSIKEQQKTIADELSATEDRIREILLSVPNVPCAMVPEGKTAADNVVEKTGGPMPSAARTPCPTGSWPRNTI